jgi:hypothetical protein
METPLFSKGGGQFAPPLFLLASNLVQCQTFYRFSDVSRTLNRRKTGGRAKNTYNI